MADAPSLCVRPAGRAYGRGDLEALRADLSESLRTTLVLELADPAQLRLGPSGETAEGYRLTQTGFRQVCNALAPGLHPLALSLAGSDRNPSDPASLFSWREAVGVYNTLLARRFGGVSGKYSLVMNVARRTIDGLAGPRFELLDHARFLELALDAAEGAGRGLAFLEATLGDRRLAVRMVEGGRLLVDPSGAAWFAGMIFANSELGGEQPAAGSPLVAQPRGRLHAIGPARGGRTIHSGRDVGGRLSRSLAAVAADRPDPDALAARMVALAAARVDGGGTGLADVTAALFRRGVPRPEAARGAAAALHGAAGDASWDGALSRCSVGSTSLLDLYKSVLALAQSLGPRRRERLERVAWTLFNAKPIEFGEEAT